jgi:superfamily II DNA or RNA helicase
MKLIVKGSLAKVTDGKVKFLRRFLSVKNPKYYWEKRSNPQAQPVLTFLDVAEKTFPAGLIEHVRPKLLKLGIDMDVRYRIEGWHQQVDPECLIGKTLRDYQIDAVKTALRTLRATLECATGAGKTAIQAAIIHYLMQRSVAPILLIVPTVSLLHQTKRELEQMLGISIGMIGNGRKQYDADVIVGIPDTLRRAVPEPASWNRKYRRMMPGKIADPKMHAFLKSVKALLCDECHHGASNTWSNLSMACPADVRLGFTGTADKKENLDYFKLMSVTGPIAARVGSKQLIDAGILARPTVFQMADPKIFGKMVSSYTGKDEIPDKRFPHGWKPKREMKPWNTIYRDAITDNRKLNRFIARIARKLVGISSPPLVFCNHERHLKNLIPAMKRFGVPFKVITGKTPVPIREKILKEFVIKNNFAVGVSTWMDEGVDVPQISALMLCGGGKARVKLIQRIGRGLRAKKQNTVIIVDFAHLNNQHTAKHADERIQECRRQKWRVVRCPKIRRVTKTDLLRDVSRQP